MRPRWPRPEADLAVWARPNRRPRRHGVLRAPQGVGTLTAIARARGTRWSPRPSPVSPVARRVGRMPASSAPVHGVRRPYAPALALRSQGPPTRRRRRSCAGRCRERGWSSSVGADAPLETLAGPRRRPGRSSGAVAQPAARVEVAKRSRHAHRPRPDIRLELRPLQVRRLDLPGQRLQHTRPRAHPRRARRDGRLGLHDHRGALALGL